MGQRGMYNKRLGEGRKKSDRERESDSVIELLDR